MIGTSIARLNIAGRRNRVLGKLADGGITARTAVDQRELILEYAGKGDPTGFYGEALEHLAGCPDATLISTGQTAAGRRTYRYRVISA
ncbi:hypothetical protein LCGC14_1285530 [marine sediment metagenome]|uniref:Uncharacterized protein n=1 Tax=marine sediment metagenome TaxID=412755 RepID=A0A0F9NX37_9ZZZZ